MGDRYCAVDGCNALEFRTTGICNRHLSMGVDPSEDSPSIEVGKHSEDMAEPQVSKPIDGNIVRTDSLLIPKIVLVYVGLSIVGGISGSNVDGWLFLYSSAMCGFFVLLPLYTIYLVFLGWKQFKDGTLNSSESKFHAHALSFIVLLGFCVLLMMLLSGVSPV